MTTQIGKAEVNVGVGEISFSMACPKCRGTGTALQRIDFETLERIHLNNPENKIQRIKEVRAMWGLGLRSAKDLVERYDKFREEVKKLEQQIAVDLDKANSKLLTELTEIDYS